MGSENLNFSPQVTLLSSEHSNQVNKLVSESFGYENPHTFFDDFPIWDFKLGHSSSCNVYSSGIFNSSGQLISHVGLRFAIMKPLQEKVALIGAVATDPAWRGKGLSTALLKYALDLCQKEKLNHVLLWGSEHEFYKKLGFELTGSQSRTSASQLVGDFNSASLTLASQVKKTRSLSTDSLGERVFQDLKNKSYGLEVTEQDRPWIFAHKTIEWLYIEKPFAYIAVGKGKDLTGFVHEMGGETNSLRAIFSHLCTLAPNFQVIAPAIELQKFKVPASQIEDEALCLATHAPVPLYYWVGGLSGV